MSRPSNGAISIAMLVLAIGGSAALLLYVLLTIVQRAQMIDACLRGGMVPVQQGSGITCMPADGRLLGRSVDTPGRMP